MKKLFVLLALAPLFTSCGIERMASLIEQSTNNINENREAVEYSTQAIRKNRELVEESSKALEENYKLIQAAKNS